MKVQIEGYEWKKVKSADIEINIPESNYFYHSYNGRVVTGIFPQYLENGQLYGLQIIQIDSEQIVKTFISTNLLSNLSATLEVKNKSVVNRLKDEVFIYLRDHYGEGEVAQAIFEKAYQKWTKKINNFLN